MSCGDLTTRSNYGAAIAICKNKNRSFFSDWIRNLVNSATTQANIGISRRMTSPKMNTIYTISVYSSCGLTFYPLVIIWPLFPGSCFFLKPNNDHNHLLISSSLSTMGSLPIGVWCHILGIRFQLSCFLTIQLIHGLTIWTTFPGLQPAWQCSCCLQVSISNQPGVMYLDCGRKPKHPEEIRTDMRGVCKLYTESTGPAYLGGRMLSTKPHPSPGIT